MNDFQKKNKTNAGNEFKKGQITFRLNTPISKHWFDVAFISRRKQHFYPHVDFLKILQTIVEKFKRG